jgi:hypothetical protein
LPTLGFMHHYNLSHFKRYRAKAKKIMHANKAIFQSLLIIRQSSVNCVTSSPKFDLE